jgi:predicted component of type VI protein secretion system
MPKIQFTTTDGTTGEYELNQERMSVGRADDNQIVIPDGSVSSHHGEFTFDGASWAFTDTGSTNGTKVGGERVESIPLQASTAFVMGSVECAFICDDAGATKAQASWEAEESPPSPAVSFSVSSSGNRSINRPARVGFGPHKKEKDGGRSMLMLLGVVGCLACLAAIFLSMKMGA